MSIDVPEDIATELVDAGRWLASRGWVPATSGNFSRRIDADTIAITASGVDKGELRGGDVRGISLREPLPHGVSAETPIHVMLYQESADIGAVLHTHSLAATVVSMAHETSIPLSKYEMLKGIRGFKSHDATYKLAVFPNAQDMGVLAKEVRAHLKSEPQTFAFALAGHGLYAWGASMREARRHIEAVEFLLSCELERGRYRP